MRVLFDHGIPVPLRDYLSEHAVDTAVDRGWSELSNGELLEHADREGYPVLITSDQSIRHQQNLSRRRIAIGVLLSNRWPRVRLRIEEIRAAVDGMEPGEVKEVAI